MDDYVTITINGDVWHVPTNQYQYLKVVNNRLVNTSSSTITLYKYFYELNSNDNYPNIYCPVGGACYVRPSNSIGNANYTLVVNSYEWSIPIENRNYDIVTVFFVIIIALSVFTSMFRRRHI